MAESGRTLRVSAWGELLFESNLACAANVRVFAAGSLCLALDEAVAAYTARTGNRVVASSGPSGRLWQMMGGGDVPDLFPSPSLDYMAAPQHPNFQHICPDGTPADSSLPFLESADGRPIFARYGSQ